MAKRRKADPKKARIGRDGIERKPITIRIPVWMKRIAFSYGKKNDLTFTDIVCAGLGAGPATRDQMRELRALMQERVTKTTEKKSDGEETAEKGAA
jgi:hypothetical protein